MGYKAQRYFFLDVFTNFGSFSQSAIGRFALYNV